MHFANLRRLVQFRLQYSAVFTTDYLLGNRLLVPHAVASELCILSNPDKRECREHDLQAGSVVHPRNSEISNKEPQNNHTELSRKLRWSPSDFAVQLSTEAVVVTRRAPQLTVPIGSYSGGSMFDEGYA